MRSLGRDGNCWFCGQKLDDRCNRHHLIPQRYFRKKRTRLNKDDPQNVVFAHMDCHKRFHLRHDNQKWSVERYAANMDEINWGKNIYHTE